MLCLNPRQIAVQVLQQYWDGADYIENLLANALQTDALKPADRRFAQELTYGVIRWQATLDWLIERKTGHRLQKPIVHILLRLGLYQMFWLDRVPDHAIVDESVNLAKRMGCQANAGFLNAVLRGYARERDLTNELLADLKKRHPHLAWSHPQWLYERWLKRWGPGQTEALLAWNNSPAVVIARVNSLKTDAARLMELWQQESVTFQPVACDWAPDNTLFRLDSHPSLKNLPSFIQGYFYIQDASTLLAVRMLELEAGLRVLDLCAAPGGKTTYIAQQMGNQGQVLACDSDPKRLPLIIENCSRLGVTCVQTSPISVLADGKSATQFDRILVDAPCSNTGVLRRRIELRWRLRPEEITRLQANQERILEQTASLLKPGGLLVYSTCSLEPEENLEVIAHFLAANPGFKLEGERTLLPFKEGVDGAYAAQLRRIQ